MKLDLLRTPYSTYGSNFSVMQEGEGGPLIIRLLWNWLGKEKLLALSFLHEGKAVPVRIDAEPHRLRILSNGGGQARLVLQGDDALAIESSGLDLRLRLCDEQAGYGYRESDRCFKLMSSITGLYAKLDVVDGSPQAQLPVSAKDWFGRVPTEVIVHRVDGHARVYLECSLWDLKPGAPPLDLDGNEAAAECLWGEFLKKMPPAPESRRVFCEQAWYVLWASFVRSGGHFKTDACLVSKTGMGAVFSWDHCFSAMALAGGDLPLALDQFMLPFTLQAPTGQLPDRVTARDMSWLWVKPPIHGWSLDHIMKSQMPDVAVLPSIYEALEKWTNWWCEFRDADNDGVPNYIFGCDVADNATIFAEESFLLESPDLSACLVLQMHTLAGLSLALGEANLATEWRNRAGVLLQKLEEHLWDGERFVVRVSGSHQYQNPCTSLVPFRVLILGELLDRKKFEVTVDLLEKEHLGPHGLSSEAMESPLYEEDGYWRGSIWAPEVYMIADGLRRGGRQDLAKEIASRFCAAVETSGFYECFNAKTGEGQRAAGLTWTASVYLLLVRDFLSN